MLLLKNAWKKAMETFHRMFPNLPDLEVFIPRVRFSVHNFVLNGCRCLEISNLVFFLAKLCINVPS